MTPDRGGNRFSSDDPDAPIERAPGARIEPFDSQDEGPQGWSETGEAQIEAALRIARFEDENVVPIPRPVVGQGRDGRAQGRAPRKAA